MLVSSSADKSVRTSSLLSSENVQSHRNTLISAACRLSNFSQVALDQEEMWLKYLEEGGALTPPAFEEALSQMRLPKPALEGFLLEEGHRVFANTRNGSLRLNFRAVHFGHKLLGRVPPPTASRFRMPVIKALGQKMGGVPGHMVKWKEEGLVEVVLREAKIDPHNLPQGWKLKGRQGLVRKIGLAFRSMHLESNPSLTMRAAVSPWEKKGLWSLTKEGVDLARKMSTNLTSAWLDRQGAALLTKLEKAIAQRYPSTTDCWDHLSNWMLKAIRNDALARYVLDEEVTDKALAGKCVWFVLNQCKSDFAKMGKNPLCRRVNGARTRTEVRKREESFQAQKVGSGRKVFGPPTEEEAKRGVSQPLYPVFPTMHSTGDVVFQQKGSNGMDTLLTFVDTLAEDAFGQELHQSRQDKILTSILMRAYPQQGSLVAKTFLKASQGLTPKEISVDLGFSVSKVGGLLKRARLVLAQDSSLKTLQESGLLH